MTQGGGEPSILGVNSNFLDNQISFVIVICSLDGHGVVNIETISIYGAAVCCRNEEMGESSPFSHCLNIPPPVTR